MRNLLAEGKMPQISCARLFSLDELDGARETERFSSASGTAGISKFGLISWAWAMTSWIVPFRTSKWPGPI